MPINPEQVSSLTPQELANRVGSILDNPDAKGNIESWENDIREADKIPSTEEMGYAYNGAQGHEKFQYTQNVLKKVIEQSGIRDSSIAFAEQIRHPPLLVHEKSRIPGQENKPQVWARETVPGEALVIARCNNNKENPDLDAVIVRLTKHQNGKIVENTGVSILLTQERYRKIVESDIQDLTPPEKLVRKILDGSMSIQQYPKEFKKIMGESTGKYWRKANEKILNSGFKRGRFESTYAEQMQRMETDYTEHLQILKEAISQVEDKVNKKDDEFEKKMEAIRSMVGFGLILNEYKRLMKNPKSQKYAADYARALIEYGLTEEELKKL